MSSRMVRYGFGVAVVVGFVNVVALAQALDVPLDGSRIRLADSPQPQGRRNTVGLQDVDVALATLDPTVSGATVSIGRVGSGPVTVLDLPASGWSRTGNAPRADFKFKSRTDPVVSARLIDGRSLRFSAYGAGAHALGGTAQGAVGVIMQVGGTRFCGLFGGTIDRDDGRQFKARQASAPAACPVLGTAPTTTTTVSTTTSTTESTTTTTESTTSTSESTTSTSESTTSTSTSTSTTTTTTVQSTTSTIPSTTTTTTTIPSTTTTTTIPSTTTSTVPGCGGDVDCDDGNDCTVDSCNVASGACANSPATQCAPCDDGNGCTQHDYCRAGACVGSSAVVCGAGDTCDPSTGKCPRPMEDCGGSLCPVGDCCGGTCLPPGTMCGLACSVTTSELCQDNSDCLDCFFDDRCQPGETCTAPAIVPRNCGAGICPNDRSCCGGNVCCDTVTETCALDQCAPTCAAPNIACGAACCGDGEVCVGGTCKTQCSAVTCGIGDQTCCGTICCDSATHMCGSVTGTCAARPDCEADEVFVPSTRTCCPVAAACGVSVNAAGLQDAERCCGALDSCNECTGECEPG